MKSWSPLLYLHAPSKIHAEREVAAYAVLPVTLFHLFFREEHRHGTVCDPITVARDWYCFFPRRNTIR